MSECRVHSSGFNILRTNVCSWGFGDGGRSGAGNTRGSADCCTLEGTDQASYILSTSEANLTITCDAVLGTLMPGVYVEERYIPTTKAGE